MRTVGRLGQLCEQPHITLNTSKLRTRQQHQLSLLQPLASNVHPTFLTYPIQQLIAINSQRVFNTFATRCLTPQVRALNGLADVNLERVFERQAQHKVPFTVKDHLKVEGLIETCGFADNLTPSSESSEVVELLQRENCIAFAHSNVPQGLLGLESSNSVFGLAANPHNPAFISGGSSGGEAVLVAAAASAFGVGSDSAGSVRMPAAFCGVYGFKPTGSKRLSARGRVGPSGAEGIKVGDLDSSFGFVTRSLQDMVWLCSKTLGRTLEDSHTQLYGGQWDAVRFEAAKGRKLRVGYMHHCHEMRSAPGIANSIDETLQLLRAEGHEALPFSFPQLHLFRNFFFAYLFQIGFFKPYARRMDSHLPTAQAHHFYRLATDGPSSLPPLFRQDQSFADLHHIFSQPQTTEQFLAIHHQAADLKRQFLAKWKAEGIDVLLTPVMPFTAPLPDVSDLLVFQLSFCAFQNAMELPAGAIPTRRVTEAQTLYEPCNTYEKQVAQSIRLSKGLPLAIQVTGSHMQDEECLAAMWQIQALLSKHNYPPLHPSHL